MKFNIMIIVNDIQKNIIFFQLELYKIYNKKYTIDLFGMPKISIKKI